MINKFLGFFEKWHTKVAITIGNNKMWYQGLTILLMIIEVVLIIISLKYLRKISITSKDFSMVFGTAKAEISNLLKEVKELITATNRREDIILNVAFHLEDIEMYTKKILNKFEQQEKYNADHDTNLVKSGNKPLKNN